MTKISTWFEDIWIIYISYYVSMKFFPNKYIFYSFNIKIYILGRWMSCLQVVKKIKWRNQKKMHDWSILRKPFIFWTLKFQISLPCKIFEWSLFPYPNRQKIYYNSTYTSKKTPTPTILKKTWFLDLWPNTVQKIGWLVF